MSSLVLLVAAALSSIASAQLPAETAQQAFRYRCTFVRPVPKGDDQNCTITGLFLKGTQVSADFHLACRDSITRFAIHDDIAGISQVGPTVTFTGTDEARDNTASVDLIGFGQAFEYGDYDGMLVLNSEEVLVGACGVYQ